MQDYIDIDYINKYFSNLSSCAIVAPAKKGTALSIKKFDNFKSLAEEYGNDEIIDNGFIDNGFIDDEHSDMKDIYNLVDLAKVLFLNNVSSVYCIAPSVGTEPSKQNYIDAFKILKCTKGFYSVVCGSNQPEIISELMKSIEDHADFPRIAFVGAPSEPQKAINLASEFKSPRLIMAFSETCLKSNISHSSTHLTAAGLAALVSKAEFLTGNLFNCYVNGLELKNQFINKSLMSDLESLNLSTLRYFNNKLEINKITPLVSLTDKLPANINNLLVLDFVVSSVMNLIFEIKNKPSFKYLTRSALISQIILLLHKHKDAELISDFLIPEINIKTDIKILISIKPKTLFNYYYINYEIII